MCGLAVRIFLPENLSSWLASMLTYLSTVLNMCDICLSDISNVNKVHVDKLNRTWICLNCNQAIFPFNHIHCLSMRYHNNGYSQ